MVLDPLTALSVAGNIVQFTDFGIKLLKDCRDLTGSVDGVLKRNREFATIAEDLTYLNKRIKKSAIFPEEDRTINEVTKECESLAKTLIEILFSLKIQPDDKQRKWHTFQQALTSMISAGKIEDLATRLSNVRAQLQTHILVNMNERVDILALHQSQMFETLDLSTRSMIRSLAADRELADKEATRNLQIGNTLVRKDITEAKTEIINAIRLLDWAEWKSTDETLEREAPLNPGQGERKAVFKSHVIKSLSFGAMTERESDIPSAHRSTFQWIYETPIAGRGTWSDFTHWLSQENGIYWVQGKPGSGKSCLMKFIYHQQETRRLLLKWAGDVPLVLASFFFWYSGTPIQKSQSGLLRYLLLQILHLQPLLTPMAFPEAWKRFSEDKLPNPYPETLGMSRGELVQAMSRVLSQKVFNLKTCLLIDGLDEFDGDHLEIVALLQSVVELQSTKICVSSRPWVVFKNSLAEYPTLKLQELTNDDITRYTQETLGKNKKMVELQQREPDEASLLIQEIVEKSSGVFLWVKLVIGSLLAGLMNNDHISDLTKRLKELPSDLEELYIHMLKRIDPYYLKQAAKLFRIVQQAHRPLPSLVISIADKHTLLDLPSSSRIRLIDEDDIILRCREIEDKIQSRCLGLLECVKPKVRGVFADPDDPALLEDLMRRAGYGHLSTTVQYMHRTVGDFFAKEESWSELLKSPAGPGILYDANKALCFASLIQLKQLFSPSRYGSWVSAYPTFKALVREFMEYAVKIEKQTSDSSIALLDDLDRTATFYYERDNAEGKYQWSSLGHTLLPYKPPNCDRETMFLAFAISYGLERYVSEKLQQTSLTASSLLFLLNFTLQSNHNSPKIIKILLSKGADPNQEQQGGTPWQRLLRYAWNSGPTFSISMSKTKKLELQEILECFICHDANSYDIVSVPAVKTATSLSNSEERLLALDIVVRTGNARVLGLLLDRGANPNYVYQGSTPWKNALIYVYQVVPNLIDDEGDRDAIIQEWVKKYVLLLEFGANPRSLVSVKSSPTQTFKQRHVSVLTVINEIFSKWDEKGASELQHVLPRGLAAELRHLQQHPQAFLALPTPPQSPGSIHSTDSCSMYSSDNSVPEVDKVPGTKKKRNKTRRSITKVFSALGI